MLEVSSHDLSMSQELHVALEPELGKVGTRTVNTSRTKVVER